MDERALNSLLGMRSYRQIRSLLEKAAAELTILDTLPIDGAILDTLSG